MKFTINLLLKIIEVYIPIPKLLLTVHSLKWVFSNKLKFQSFYSKSVLSNTKSHKMSCMIPHQTVITALISIKFHFTSQHSSIQLYNVMYANNNSLTCISQRQFKISPWKRHKYTINSTIND
jgi:hypothetical protein